MTTPGFDPQHDARFQRGYDPKSAPAAGPLGLGVDVGVPTDAPYGSRAEARAAARPPREAADPWAEAGASGAEASTLGAGSEDFVRGTVGDEQFETPRSPRGNPFVIALWVLGPLLLVGGFALIVQSSSNNGYSYSGNEIPWAMVLQQITWTVAPSMMSAGLATIMGLLFWHAFAWHRARSAATPTPTTRS
ncbi:hypothetical protein D6T64_01790 [Cryobacterium melibiosiphilum]|uniref:Uncharacterized protein n=1 Tax=Cryobacterium melibiosiphilum TaxID=995039 RepID=A0A3A5MZF8_9MICO|nr:hypothetical protein [Cryobacterium melibiosiphilum]RJT91446.1 hypothetical protein D6T64_01790 [Cryobacterium melibiosiphilum]